MSSIRHGSALIVFASLCAGLWLACSSCAQDLPQPVSAPPNPEFIDFVLHKSGRSAEHSGDGRYLGAIPSPVDLSYNTGASVRLAANLQSLPAQYDLRLESPARLSPVRDQGPCGSCWAFASYGSLESCLMPLLGHDLSENHLKNTHGFDWSCCAGGTHLMTIAYLARWNGGVCESNDHYNPGDCTSPSGLSPVVRLQSVDFFPNRSGPLDNATIKQAVISSGAVYTTMYWSSGFYSSEFTSYYCPSAQALNHAVCIVGWDDGYPATGFSQAAPGDGAFIVRNSWGDGWGDGGYFYVSYYDTVIGKDLAAFRSATSDSEFSRVYQYDPFGWVASAGYGSSTAWFANVFTAVAPGAIGAVSFYTGSPGSEYEVRIYRDPVSGPLSSSGPVCVQTGTLEHFGYHTIPLDSAVEISTGRKFSAVVKVISPGCNTPIAYEYPMSDYSSQATSNLGESYISANGSSWTDIKNIYDRANVCLKVFVSDTQLTASPSTDAAFEGPVRGPFLPANGSYTLSNVGTEPIEWSADTGYDWLAVSPSEGCIAPGGSAAVSVSITEAAGNLPAGYYTTTLNFRESGDSRVLVSRPVNLAVIGSYDIREVPFSWLEPANATVLSLGDDSVSAAQDIPFEFSLYEKPYTKLYVSSNGMVGFAVSGLTSSANVDLPSAALPNAVLCPYWDDINPKNGGAVTIGTCGSSPDRKLVVSWVDVPLKKNSASKLTFQAVLCEGSKDIVFNYRNVAETDVVYGAGRGATVGLENDSGTLGSRRCFDGSALLRNKSSIRLTAQGPSLSACKLQPDGERVDLSRRIVTAAFSDRFYVGSEDRIGGIAVLMPNHPVTVGVRCSVSGHLGTTSHGERCINAVFVRQDGAGSAEPLLMNVPALGGADWGIVGTGGQQGVTYGTGLNTIGMLVRLFGIVRGRNDGYFHIDDLSSRDLGGLAKVVCPPEVQRPLAGSVVGVTGISSLEVSEGTAYRVLRVRSTSDIDIFSPPTP